jgi:cell wall-associated NlpC family hydrolase
MEDPAGVAELFLGAPYLWGGNGSDGLDCSGLVQAALLACGVPCPGDSDQQEERVGRPLAEGEPLRRGDLVFWKGHVAMALDAARLIHANAGAMAVAVEALDRAVVRIGAQGDGCPTSRRRLPAPAAP